MGVIRYTFYSEALREQTNIMAIVPSFEPWRHRMSAKEFYGTYSKHKVLYICHGGSDDSSLYLRRTRIEEYANERDLIVIFPEVRNSFYSNMVRGKKYFTYLTEELPKVVENLFPVSNKREDRYVLGNSMGSHGAFKWAFHRPDFFAAAANLSGISFIMDIFGGNGFAAKDAKDKCGPVALNWGSLAELEGSMSDSKEWVDKAVREGTKLPKLFAAIGTEDYSYKLSCDYLQYCKEQGIEVHYEEMPGQHEWAVWDTMIERFMAWALQ